MSKMLVDITKGIDALRDREDIVTRIRGSMTVFPLCCSTGVLRSVAADYLKAGDEPTFESPVPDVLTNARINVDKPYIHQIIEKASRPPFMWPKEVVAWNALSLILLKMVEGKDTGNVGGYSNYKAAQIAMFDRTTEGKRNAKRFNSYNIVFALDQFFDWLKEREDDLGEVVISTPQTGAHGGDVRGCIFTPNVAAIQKFHDSHIEQVRDHVRATLAHYESVQKEEAPEPQTKLEQAIAW